MKRALLLSWFPKRLLRAVECSFFGGKVTEAILIKLLHLHYRSRFRRDWLWSKEGPHFFNHRIGCFDFMFGNASGGGYPYYRGFFVSELLRQGDRLLDIGCGDGFFTKRFFSKRCENIDAIDVEADAIESAQRHNAASNIRYYLLDAVDQPFPADKYNVVVWDGAIGHFAATTTKAMQEKIILSMTNDGVFAGSESLGHEGHDHLQFFQGVEDLDLLFGRHFTYRAYRVIEYDTGFAPGLIRREVFWRCSAESTRIERSGWTTLTGKIR